MQIRQLRSDDSLLLYKCLARNEFGSSERLIKLIALGVPRPPAELRVRDVWSRSALISWQPPSLQPHQQHQSHSRGQAEASGRISNYTVQYWRKNPAARPPVSLLQQQQPHSLAPKQNHRRDDLVVDGLHNSALLVNLLPAVTYEVSVIAHNQVGRSEPSELINVTTSEEEPSAPPTDVQAEPRGSSTLRVMWKVPPSETLNGRLLGFYVGYRPRFLLQNAAAVAGASGLLQVGASQPPILGGLAMAQSQQQQQQQQQQQMLQSVIYSFKTADAYEGQIFYETFLANLKHNQEYEIAVRAFNKAGSGPDCHVITARTSSARLPQAPNLQVQKVTASSVTLKWTVTVFATAAAAAAAGGSRAVQQQQQQFGNLMLGSGAEILRYVLYYQAQGERDWYELTVGRPAVGGGREEPQSQQQAAQDPNLLAGDEQLLAGELIGSQASVHTLSNLQAGYTYRVYVAAANDYGIGDPSNVVSLRTDAPASPGANNGSANYPASLGPAVLDGDDDSGRQAGGFLDQWGRQPHQWGLLYTTLTFGALMALLIVLAAYLIWQHRIRNKYNHSSSASSYPSSWTPAASDTIQSEYSVKRFPGAGPNGAAADLFASQPDQHPAAAARFTANRQQQRNNLAGASLARPMPQLSSHYHQPADLISNSSTLQLHSAGPLRHQKTSATLNRNQNRQLPPIPYSTMSVKEMHAGPNKQQLRLQQDGYRQQQQLLLRSNKQPQPHKQMATSQTPLIYGVIE